MIQQLMIKYLIQNGRLGLPDIGSFQLKHIPAQIQESGTLLKGPAAVIEYRYEPIAADKHLFEFISMETEADEVTAIRRFNEWINELKQTLSEQKTVVLPRIGSLSQTPEGVIIFNAAERELTFKNVSLPNGMVWEQAEAEHETIPATVDTSWWIYAIILLLAGIAAIVYHYI